MDNPEPAPADAAPETTSSEPELISRKEAEEAFRLRDKAKAELREARERLSAIEKAQADAERAKAEKDGDLQKQLEILRAEQEQLLAEKSQLSETLTGLQRAERTAKVEAAILAHIPDPKNHEITKKIVAALAQASDDASSVEDLAAAALDEVKQAAPHFLEKPRVAPHGIIPPDGLHPTRDQLARQAEERMRNAGFAGFKKVL